MWSIISRGRFLIKGLHLFPNFALKREKIRIFNFICKQGRNIKESQDTDLIGVFR